MFWSSLVFYEPRSSLLPPSLLSTSDIPTSMATRTALSPRNPNRLQQQIVEKPSPVRFALQAASNKKRKLVIDPLPAYEDEVQRAANHQTISDVYAPIPNEPVSKKQKTNKSVAPPAPPTKPSLCRKTVGKKTKDDAKDQNAEWRRKYAKIMKTHVFYFDLVDGTRAPELMESIMEAGAVRLTLPLSLIPIAHVMSRPPRTSSPRKSLS